MCVCVCVTSFSVVSNKCGEKVGVNVLLHIFLETEAMLYEIPFVEEEEHKDYD